MIRILVNAATVFAAIAVIVMTALPGLAQYSDTAILEIRNEKQDRIGVYNIAALEALGLHSIATETPWTEGEMQFEGVLVRDLLRQIGVKTGRILAIALNDYRISIPVSDFENFDVILATRINGSEMSVRDRGPIWLIYPWSSEPVLRDEVYFARSIWQLRMIQVQPD